jgi:hypothetical protein
MRSDDPIIAGAICGVDLLGQKLRDKIRGDLLGNTKLILRSHDLGIFPAIPVGSTQPVSVRRYFEDSMIAKRSDLLCQFFR